MKTIRAIDLSLERFIRYGRFANMLSPGSTKIGDIPSEFFRDVLSMKLGSATVASLSTCRVSPRPPVIDVLEYHNHCGEAMIPLDGDVLVQVAPATPDSKIPYDDIEVFIVPKGTIVVFEYGVWHHAPFACEKTSVSILSILPERTYANDAVVISIPEEKRIAIEI